MRHVPDLGQHAGDRLVRPASFGYGVADAYALNEEGGTMTNSTAIRLALLLCLSLPAEAAPGRVPPPEAIQACQGKQGGDACSIEAPRGTVEGTCRNLPGAFACVPEGRMPPNAMRQSGREPSPRQGGRVAQPLPDGAPPAANAMPARSRVVDTGQVYCFDTAGAVIACPQRGRPLFGQDAQYLGTLAAYRDNGDGTVTDLNTGLVWQKAHNAQRVGYYEAKRDCESLTLGGRRDWRLPTIKELFSIADFSGSQGTGRFYLDSRYFDLAYPSATDDLGREPSHYPQMMGQTWSSTIYTGNHMGRGVEAAFFFNFFDGHIKNAPTRGPFHLFHRCVSGPTYLARNDFHDNGDGTVTDRATGLVWQRSDDGRTRDWPAALAYCANLDLGGRRDWRLPNVKELQSIVDYRRSDPALDTRFLHQTDPGAWFWSSTSHGDNTRMAAYVCFGKCVSVDGVDTHGAGGQRADPKTGDPADYASLGGQHDQVRIDNYVRCVR